MTSSTTGNDTMSSTRHDRDMSSGSASNMPSSPSAAGSANASGSSR
jgi:hypothetical protein